ncbi:MAG: UV DNA damage repair endonuclease UvsE [bacterium]|nr:UV DNA damage repair endonuclease UvsE [bacterium]
MKIRLGYVDGPISFPNDKFKTMTYTKYKLQNEEISLNELDNILDNNLKVFKKILKFNKKYNITFYRMSHTLVPLATKEEVDFDYIEKYKEKWLEIGNYIKKNNMRVDSHPNQYCVLNSANEKIVSTSIDIINFNYLLFKAMDINGQIILHIGTGKDSKEEALERFKYNFNKLDSEAKKIIILENDDKTYTAFETLLLCEELGIPMVLDYHHYLCNKGRKENIKKLLPRIMKTWDGTDLNPKMHFSSPKDKKNFRSHSDYINYNSFIRFLNILKEEDKDIDIMLETKKKEDALLLLMRQLETNSDVKVVNNSTFIY